MVFAGNPNSHNCTINHTLAGVDKCLVFWILQNKFKHFCWRVGDEIFTRFFVGDVTSLGDLPYLHIYQPLMRVSICFRSSAPDRCCLIVMWGYTVQCIRDYQGLQECMIISNRCIHTYNIHIHKHIYIYRYRYVICLYYTILYVCIYVNLYIYIAPTKPQYAAIIRHNPQRIVNSPLLRIPSQPGFLHHLQLWSQVKFTPTHLASFAAVLEAVVPQGRAGKCCGHIPELPWSPPEKPGEHTNSHRKCSMKLADWSKKHWQI